MVAARAILQAFCAAAGVWSARFLTILLRSHSRPSPEGTKQRAWLGVAEEICDFVSGRGRIAEHRRCHRPPYLFHLLLERCTLVCKPSLQCSSRNLQLG